MVTAAEQTAGRGRQGRVWTAPDGKALLYSAILRPLDERHLLLPLAVPLAICAAAEALRPGIACQVKWPNDVWLDGRKLSGTLIEARFPSPDSAAVTGERRTKRDKDAGRPNSSAIRPTEDAAPRSVRRRQARAGSLVTGTPQPQDGWAVIGIGLNLTIAPDEFPADLRQPATSLFAATAEAREEPRRNNSGEARAGLLPSLRTAAAVLSRHLDHWVFAADEEVLGEWRRRDALRGREVAWEDGSGVADGIDDRGNLVVALAGGGRAVLGAGEVQLRL